MDRGGRVIYRLAPDHPNNVERLAVFLLSLANGLLFGVIPDPDYPVCELTIRAGDRFLLYTDGLIEPQNAEGESFGDRKLKEVIRANQARPGGALVEQLLSEIRVWQPAALPQQDDIAVVVVDVG
jgi:phosphoserine phosphatase RsbU/P